MSGNVQFKSWISTPTRGKTDVVPEKCAPQGPGGISTTDSPPWRCLSSKIVHATDWFEVHRDRVTLPDGSSGVYEGVNSPGAVTVLALDDDDHVVITRQWIYLHGATQWRLPGGGIDRTDDSPLTSAKRELAEETGLRAKHWQSLGKINCADSLTNHVVHLYLATELSQGESDLGPGEADLRVTRLPFAKAVDMAMANEVPDAGSAHALVMHAARRMMLAANRAGAAR